MNCDSSNLGERQRRRHRRIKVKISVEIRTSENAAPMRLATDDVSLGGCYVETMFPLDIGTKVFMTLWLNEEPVRTAAAVATRFPQLGNGYSFTDMSADDLLKLGAFITAVDTQARAASGGGN